MNIIKNDEFIEAMKNLDNIKIINRAIARYTKYLDDEIVQQIKMDALWKAMMHFEQSKNMRFTTYLYHRVVWECKDYLSQNKTIIKTKSSNFYGLPSLNKDIEMFETYDDMYKLLPALEYNIAIDMSLNHLTHKEICLKYKINSIDFKKMFKRVKKKIEKWNKKVNTI